MSPVIVISKGTELLRIPSDRLVYISADGNYSYVVTQDNRSKMVSFQLGQLEDLIGDQLGKPHRVVRQAIVFNLLYTTFPVVVYVSAVI